MQKNLFYKENNQVPQGSQTMNECYYIHCCLCHNHPGFDSCKKRNHTIERKLLVWTRSTKSPKGVPSNIQALRGRLIVCLLQPGAT